MARGLHDTAPTRGVRYLVHVKLENGRLVVTPLERHRVETFEPA